MGINTLSIFNVPIDLMVREGWFWKLIRIRREVYNIERDSPTVLFYSQN